METDWELSDEMFLAAFHAFNKWGCHGPDVYLREVIKAVRHLIIVEDRLASDPSLRDDGPLDFGKLNRKVSRRFAKEAGHDWKPSEAMVEAIVPLLSDYHSKTTYRLSDEAVSILLVARDLIIAEARPQIEAAERERFANLLEIRNENWAAQMVRSF